MPDGQDHPVPLDDPPEHRLMHRLLWRWFLFTCGWLCVALGSLGVVLPVLPTTPFMLLAAFCFDRSSPRFHRWLLSTKLFGPLIENWQRERYIEKRSKRVALGVVAVTFGISIAVVGPWPLKVMLVGFWLACTLGIGRLPTVPLSQRYPPQGKDGEAPSRETDPPAIRRGL